jgi:hypothetical protein
MMFRIVIVKYACLYLEDEDSRPTALYRPSTRIALLSMLVYTWKMKTVGLPLYIVLV